VLLAASQVLKGLKALLRTAKMAALNSLEAEWMHSLKLRYFLIGKLWRKSGLGLQGFPDRETPLAYSPVVVNNLPNGKRSKP
jgi:hypothetical protein